MKASTLCVMAAFLGIALSSVFLIRGPSGGGAGQHEGHVETAVQQAIEALGPLPAPLPRRAAANLEDGAVVSWRTRVNGRSTLSCTLDNTGSVSWRIDLVLPGSISGVLTVTPEMRDTPILMRHCEAVFSG